MDSVETDPSELFRSAKHIHYVSSWTQTFAWECNTCRLFEPRIERVVCTKGCTVGHIVVGGTINEETDPEDPIS